MPGNALTVTVEVTALQPVVVSVNMNVTFPAAIPVTSPELVTVAFDTSLLVQVPPVEGDRFIVLPAQTEVL